MPGIPDFVLDGPWWWLFAALVMIVFVRTQATYWLARWARAGADAVADGADQDSRRARIAKRFSGPAMTKAQAFTERWGWIAIPLSFLTLGIQSLVNGGAGYARMHWGRYTLAMIPGCFLWAGAYELVGYSAWRAFTQSPWMLLGSVALVAAGIVTAVVVRRRRARTSAATPTSASAA